MEKHIQTLLDRYKSSYVEGECRSTEYDNQQRRKRILNERYMKLENLLFEFGKYVNFTNTQKNQTRYLIQFFNNHFNDLHRRVSDEVIILAFIFYILRIEDSRIKPEHYRVCKKYGLTETIYSLIVTNMLHLFMQHSPSATMETTSYDHEILLETHGKII